MEVTGKKGYLSSLVTLSLDLIVSLPVPLFFLKKVNRLELKDFAFL
jgi:hypothetical protein